MTKPTGSNAQSTADLPGRFEWNLERRDAELSRAMTPSKLCPLQNRPVMPPTPRRQACTRRPATQGELQDRTMNKLETETTNEITDHSDTPTANTHSKDQHA